MLKEATTLILFVVSWLPMASFAISNCGDRTIEEVWVEGPRDDGHAHANSMLLKLSGSDCNGKAYVYINNSAPAFDSLLSTALLAKTTGALIGVYVNSGVVTATATELSILTLR